MARLVFGKILSRKQAAVSLAVLILGLIAFGAQTSKHSDSSMPSVAQRKRQVPKLSEASNESERKSQRMIASSAGYSAESLDEVFERIKARSLHFLRQGDWSLVPIKNHGEAMTEFEARAHELGLELDHPDIIHYVGLCDEGFPDACELAGYLLNREESDILKRFSSLNDQGLDAEHRKAMNRVEEKMDVLQLALCVQGFGFSCRNAYRIVSDAKDKDAVEALTQYLCDRKFLPYCESLEEVLDTYGVSQPEKVQLRQSIALENCKDGLATSCGNLLRDKTIPLNDQRLIEAFQQLDDQCENWNFTENRWATPCSEAAKVLKAKGDFESAAETSFSACNNGDLEACLTGVKFAVGHDWADDLQIKNALHKYCDEEVDKQPWRSADSLESKMCLKLRNSSGVSVQQIWNQFYSEAKAPKDGWFNYYMWDL